jgi:hypothetical protein
MSIPRAKRREPQVYPLLPSVGRALTTQSARRIPPNATFLALTASRNASLQSVTKCIEPRALARDSLRSFPRFVCSRPCPPSSLIDSDDDKA